MAGRPGLRIGQHGKVKRTELDTGLWLARCRYRDTDGVTRVVERQSPTFDQHGKAAEDALLDSLTTRRAPGTAADITANTKITELITLHIERMEDDWAERTTDTYRYTAGKLAKLIGGLRVGETTPPRVDAALRSMRTAHGAGMSKQALTLMRGALHLAVMGGTIPSNPVRDVKALKPTHRGTTGKGAKAVDTAQLGQLIDKLKASEFCQTHDLADPITMLIATGLRRSELLGLRWVDYDSTGGFVTVTGKLVRISGKGLKRIDETKTAAGARVIALPIFAKEMLQQRKRVPYYGEQKMMFPSTAGTWRDPDNFNRKWREARDALGVPDVTSHSFRKTMATMIDEGGLSARVGADHLGHARISMTQDVYMARGRVHAEVADLVEQAVRTDG
jgi:integrase